MEQVMKANVHLLVIDAQNDFCDLPENYLPRVPGSVSPDELMRPGLPVKGAHDDMLRLAEFMKKGIRGFSDMSITLDSHHKVGIERPSFWMKGDGSDVAPFTEITAQNVRDGLYLPRNPRALARVLAYLTELEARGRYKLMVWAPHCEIGTWGHNVHFDIHAAYNEWEVRELGVVNKVTKGSNPWTEHYSALMAEVPDLADPSTQLNRGFIDILNASDLLLISGQAGSHCVKATTLHIADNFGDANLHKVVLLTDCMSPVSGFEGEYAQFLSDMRARGLQTATAQDMLGEVLANGRR
jgi:nicotinamidase/pyrazinamidase